MGFEREGSDLETLDRRTLIWRLWIGELRSGDFELAPLRFEELRA